MQEAREARRTGWGPRILLVLQLALVALGLSRVAAQVTGNGALRFLGTQLKAAPYPRVFERDLFQQEFELELAARSGEIHRFDGAAIDELFRGLDGPFDRRDVYMRAFRVAPMRPDREWPRGVLRYALCGEGPLVRALGLDEPVQRATLLGRRLDTGEEASITVEEGP